MKIDVYLSEFCGSYLQLNDNMDRALAEIDVEAEVTYYTVYYTEAVNRGIKGTPSIWINGKDAFKSKISPGIM